MAAAVLTEMELQNSMATSEEDADFEEDDELAAMEANADAFAANTQLQNGMLQDRSEGEENEEAEGDEEAISDGDAEEEEDDGEEEEDGDEDEDGEGVGAVKIQPGLLEDDDEDAASASDEEESAASVEDDEDDESKDSTDAEVETKWVPAPEEEEDDEPANPNRCMYVWPPICCTPIGLIQTQIL
jgi:histone acetyltransferase SAS3